MTTSDALSTQDAPVLRVVLLEGNICAGKTTLNRRMGKYCDWCSVDEPLHLSLFEQFSKSDLCANERQIAAFAFQMVMHERRVHAFQLAQMRANAFQWIALDRSLIGDYAFALANYIDGSLTDNQFELYHEKKAQNPAAILTPLLREATERLPIVFLVQTAGDCQNRLTKRPGVDSELPLDYLTKVSIAHYMAIVSLADKKKTFQVFITDKPPWNDSSDEECQQFLDRIRGGAEGLFCAKKLESWNEIRLPRGSLSLERYEKACKNMNIPTVGVWHGDNLYVCEYGWHVAMVHAFTGAV